MASGPLGGHSSGIGNQLHGPYFRLICSVFGGVRLWNGMNFRGVVFWGGGWARSILGAKGERGSRGLWRPMPVLHENRRGMWGYRSSLLWRVADRQPDGKCKILLFHILFLCQDRYYRPQAGCTTITQPHSTLYGTGTSAQSADKKNSNIKLSNKNLTCYCARTAPWDCPHLLIHSPP